MSREIWLISDTHFGHENILKFTDENGHYIRGDHFTDVNTMDEYMIEKWNSVVKKGDKVYHLGDVYFGSKDRAYNILSRLNGNKRLILGNHDDPWSAPIMKWFHKVYLFRCLKDFNITLSHVPMHPDSIKWKNDGGINVHGHIHERIVKHDSEIYSTPKSDDRYRCVSVEQINYTPVNIEEVRIR